MYIMIYHTPGYEDWCRVNGKNVDPVTAYRLKWELIRDGQPREIQLGQVPGEYVEYIG